MGNQKTSCFKYRFNRSRTVRVLIGALLTVPLYLWNPSQHTLWSWGPWDWRWRLKVEAGTEERAVCDDLSSQSSAPFFSIPVLSWCGGRASSGSPMWDWAEICSLSNSSGRKNGFESWGQSSFIKLHYIIDSLCSVLMWK